MAPKGILRFCIKFGAAILCIAASAIIARLAFAPRQLMPSLSADSQTWDGGKVTAGSRITHAFSFTMDRSMRLASRELKNRAVVRQ